MKIFISGGCKNGKSYLAQRLAKRQENGYGLYYIATMAAADSEDEERVARHHSERVGWGFTTIEVQRDIENILGMSNSRASFLLDSLTALLENEMFPPEEGLGWAVNMQAHEKIGKGLLQILGQVNNIVIVSDFIYSDAIIFEPLTEMYRKHLAALDALAARHCDTVLEVAYNQTITHKGETYEIF